MNAGRVRFIVFATALAALVSSPRTSRAQRKGQWWAIDAHAGYGLIAGDARQLMRPPGLITATLRFRKPESSWWFGIDLNDLRAPATRAGSDTLAAHAPGYIAATGDRRAYYRLSSFSFSVRHDYQSRGLFTPYAVGGLGWGISRGMICDAATCAQSEGPLDGHSEYRPVTMLGGGAMVRLSDLAPRFRNVPLSLSAEMRLVSLSTNHGSLWSAPLLVGLSM